MNGNDDGDDDDNNDDNDEKATHYSKKLLRRDAWLSYGFSENIYHKNASYLFAVITADDEHIQNTEKKMKENLSGWEKWIWQGKRRKERFCYSIRPAEWAKWENHTHTQTQAERTLHRRVFWEYSGVLVIREKNIWPWVWIKDDEINAKTPNQAGWNSHNSCPIGKSFGIFPNIFRNSRIVWEKRLKLHNSPPPILSKFRAFHNLSHSSLIKKYLGNFKRFARRVQRCCHDERKMCVCSSLCAAQSRKSDDVERTDGWRNAKSDQYVDTNQSWCERYRRQPLEFDIWMGSYFKWKMYALCTCFARAFPNSLSIFI